MWEKILRTYSDLPEAHRTSSIVADKLRSEGCSVHPARIRQVLEANVLAELSAEDILTTGRTLKLLMDISSPNSCRSENANFLTRQLLGCWYHIHPVAVRDLIDAIEQLVMYFEYNQYVKECMEQDEVF